MAWGAGDLKYESFSSVDAKKIALGQETQSGWYRRFGKRVFDVTLAVLILPLLTPAIAILWLMAQRDGGPGFFGHERVGQGGTFFKCWKIRSMVHDANERLEVLLASDPVARAEWERDQKLSNDPRITGFGRFIRRTSLDELPQILNVLRGEMSFVGPRPVVEEELERYGLRKRTYLAMKPGITGLWQVSGRNDVGYSERVAMDVSYSRQMSFLKDTQLIMLTARSVLLSTGK